MEDNLSYMRTAAPLLAPIFRSDGQARLLAALLLKGDELSITDLAERTDLAYPTVHREVGRLLDAGILAERQVGRTRLIRAAEDSPLVEPLRLILTMPLARPCISTRAVRHRRRRPSTDRSLRGRSVPGPAPPTSTSRLSARAH